MTRTILVVALEHAARCPRLRPGRDAIEGGQAPRAEAGVNQGRKPLPGKVSATIFTVRRRDQPAVATEAEGAVFAKKPSVGGARPEGFIPAAQSVLHPVVNGLHSIEEQADRAAYFSLTQKTGGVQRQSFFDSFPSFSGWRSVRGPSPVALHTARCKERKAGRGSIAKCWSRRTGRPVEGRIESRGVTLVYPVGGEPGARVIDRTRRPRKGKQR